MKLNQNTKKFSFLFLLSFLFFLLSGCANKRVTVRSAYDPLKYNECVTVYSINDPFPEKYEFLGEVKYGDSGFSDECDYIPAIESAKTEARKIGGNVLKVTRHKRPDLLNSCHRLTISILRVDPQYIVAPRQEKPSGTDSDYASLCIYRTNSTEGSLVNYNVYLDDQLIYRARNNSKCEINLREEGPIVLKAKSETDCELTLDIRLGESYYVKTTINTETMEAKPTLEEVDAASGAIESSTIKTISRIKSNPFHDRMVFKDGREVKCIITGSDDQYIYYTTYKNGEKTKMKIEKTQIKSIKRDK